MQQFSMDEVQHGYSRYFSLTDNKLDNRRSQRAGLNWKRFLDLSKDYPFPKPKVYVNIWGSPRDVSAEEPYGRIVHVRIWRGLWLSNRPELLYKPNIYVISNS